MEALTHEIGHASKAVRGRSERPHAGGFPHQARLSEVGFHELQAGVQGFRDSGVQGAEWTGWFGTFTSPLRHSLSSANNVAFPHVLRLSLTLLCWPTAFR